MINIISAILLKTVIEAAHSACDNYKVQRTIHYLHTLNNFCLPEDIIIKERNSFLHMILINNNFGNQFYFALKIDSKTHVDDFMINSKHNSIKYLQVFCVLLKFFSDKRNKKLIYPTNKIFH